ncbi:MAG: hypothetical protein L6R37_005668 [Teloschistes peruensis]|nr:MAG: hypothetical protein L6R37_005668 [Teloschistes peruensis]
MAEDIVIHGAFVQFNGIARCRSCQAHNLKCALQESDDGCMSCAGAGRQCIFIRTRIYEGPKRSFRWSTLLNKDSAQAPMQPPPNGTMRSPTAILDRPPQTRQAPISQIVNGLSPVSIKDESSVARKFLARSNSSPETEESRSRTGLDPTQRDKFGKPASFVDPIPSKNEHTLPSPRVQPLVNARDPQQQLFSPRTQPPLWQTKLASTQADPRSPTLRFSDGKERDDAYPRLAPRNGRTTIDCLPVQVTRDDAVHASTSSVRSDSEPRTTIVDLCPSIPSFLLDRIVNEHILRYRVLCERSSEHLKLRRQGPCPSGDCCLDDRNRDQWRSAGVRHSHPSPGEGLARKAQLASATASEYDDEDNDVEEVSNGPLSWLMSHYSRFPAKFECPLCFQFKEYSKPSDWIKHVHEDLQPFVCTFEECPEPKSFKRKADWVRHENERHRQLEWWTCNQQGCSHKCFRKDNFVQHLVREHKMPEPKLRASQSSLVRGESSEPKGPNEPSNARSGLRRPASSPTPDSSHAPDPVGSDFRKKTPTTTDGENGSMRDPIWDLVDDCRQETEKRPGDERCKFCGASMTSWKKLTVHLAKHMEQIAITLGKAILPGDVTPRPIAGRRSVASVTDDNDTARSRDDRFSPMDTDDDEGAEETQVHSPASPPSSSKYVGVLARFKKSGEPINGPTLEYTSSTPPHFGYHTRPRPYQRPPRERIHKCNHCERCFSTANDLDRHVKSIHKIIPRGGQDKSFRCAAPDCSKKDKIWPRLDNFRQHCLRIHPDENTDELVKKSTIIENQELELRQVSRMEG